LNTNTSICPRILIAGTNSRVGKTTITDGIILALVKRGLKVQSFKTGPDYIDPSYHSLFSGRACRNLDTWMLSKNSILELFERQAELSDISVIEGVMGLYDGLKDREDGSSAHLAKILKCPVILVVDASSMSRSAGAVVLGYKQFDKNVNLKGVILNRVGSISHYKSLKSAIEKATRVLVLGYLPKDKDLILPERHLGLVPTQENAPLKDFKNKLLTHTKKNIDVNKIIGISQSVGTIPNFERKLFPNRVFMRYVSPCHSDPEAKPKGKNLGVKGILRSPAVGGVPQNDRSKISIAIAKDAAFNFYYQDNLDLLKHYGAELIEFSPLRDKLLPSNIGGIYIGGGFPELFAAKLSKNITLRRDILKKAKTGMPIYAECAGLMYLSKEIIDFENKKYPMVGIFNASSIMGNRLRALGYVNIQVQKNNILSKKGSKVRAHMFHWSYLKQPIKKEQFAYKVKKNKTDITLDGLTKWKTLASYAHLHFASNPIFAKNFINHCSQYKANAYAK